MRQLFYVAVVATLLVAVRAVPPEIEVPNHNVFQVNYNTQRQDLYIGQQFNLPLDDLHFEFSSKVYERQDPLEENILDDFEGQSVRNTNAYTTSDRCWLEPTQVTFDRLTESGYFPDGIDAYLFDSNYGVYILSNRQLVFYIVGVVGSEINMIKYAHYNLTQQPLNPAEAQFAKISGSVMITDGVYMYRLSVDTTHSDDTAMLQLQQINGYESLKSYEEFIKIVELNVTHFLVVAFNKVVMYALDDMVTARKLDYVIPDELNSKIKEFTDAIVAKNKLYLLEVTVGIVVLPVANLNTYELVELTGYGRLLKMEIVNRTIEVICEYHKNKFIAELLIRQDKYILNRFYNQISDFKDIDFQNNKGLFIGQHEILILSHSINRNALLNLTQQYMKTYQSYGINAFEVMKPFSNDTSAVLIGVSREEAIVVGVRQTPPILRCNFNGISSGAHTFVVEIQSSFCGTITYHEWQERFGDIDVTCRIRYPMVLKFTTPFQAKSRNIISISSIALWFALILVLLGVAAKWGTKMNGLLRTLRDEIHKKRNSNQSRGTVGSNVNMLRNPI